MWTFLEELGSFVELARPSSPKFQNHNKIEIKLWTRVYTWNFIWNWRLYLTVVSKKKLTICLTRYRNYNKEKVCVIKRSFYPPKITGDHRIFVKNLFKFLHSRVEDIFYCFSVILLRKVKCRDEHIELKLNIISKLLLTRKYCENVSQRRNSPEKQNIYIFYLL